MTSKVREYHEELKRIKKEKAIQEKQRKQREKTEARLAAMNIPELTISEETGFILDNCEYLPTEEEIRYAVAEIRARNLDNYANGQKPTP